MLEMDRSQRKRRDKADKKYRETFDSAVRPSSLNHVWVATHCDLICYWNDLQFSTQETDLPERVKAETVGAQTETELVHCQKHYVLQTHTQTEHHIKLSEPSHFHKHHISPLTNPNSCAWHETEFGTYAYWCMHTFRTCCMNVQIEHIALILQILSSLSHIHKLRDRQA